MLLRTEQWFWFFASVLLIGLVAFGPHPSFASASLLKQADSQISGKKFKVAARTITKAMNSGELSDDQMAKALYRRGVAYNGSGRHGSAIADLTGALWLGKLDAKARKDAYAQRAIAYRATGYKKLSARDLGKAGQRAAKLPWNSKKPIIAKPAPSIPGFNTVVRAAKKVKPPKRAKLAAKKAVPPKAAIPSFRTSIVPE